MRFVTANMKASLKASIGLMTWRLQIHLRPTSAGSRSSGRCVRIPRFQTDRANPTNLFPDNSSAPPTQMEAVNLPEQPRPPLPPFNAESAALKVKNAENAWNSRDPDKVALAYTKDSRWRNRTEFLEGRDAIRTFLKGKWEKELDYRLMKELWCFTDDKIAVRFEYEWHDSSGQWHRTHGNELWHFDAEGLMKHRDMSANDYDILETERRYRFDRE